MTESTPEPQLTGLQKRAEKFLNKPIVFQKMPGETVRGNFIGFDEDSVDRAVIQISNAADRTTVPLMYVVNYFEEKEEAKIEALNEATYEKRPGYKPHR
jgi:hypothetical protein